MPQPTDFTQIAPAKVNLCLHITGKRHDGLHLLDSIVVFPEFGDILLVADAQNLSLIIDGPFGEGLSNTDNLVIQAEKLLDKTGGAALRLTKNLPLSSGIGGGSSDAAAALRLLASFWDCPIPEMTELLKLGADVPVCMSRNPQQMRGIGDKLTNLPALPKFAILLVNAGFPVPTGQIFGALQQVNNPPVEPFENIIDANGFFTYLARQRNDMQPAAIQEFSEIQNVIDAISSTKNCKLARMSGSGGTCFGLYETLEQAQNAGATVTKCYPDWWVKPAKV